MIKSKMFTKHNKISIKKKNTYVSKMRLFGCILQVW